MPNDNLLTPTVCNDESLLTSLDYQVVFVNVMIAHLKIDCSIRSRDWSILTVGFP